MKKTLLLTILFFITSAATSFAQTDHSEGQYLSDSSRALQFQIGSNFTLNSFQGSTISFKYHLSRTSAFRAGLSIDLSSTDGEGNSGSFISDTVSSIADQNSDMSSYMVQFRTQYIYNINPGSKFLLYTGAGPLFGYDKSQGKSETEYQYPRQAPIKSISDQKRTMGYAGISGLMGVEWFASSGISLSAEYGLDIRYFWTKQEQTQQNLQINSSKVRNTTSIKSTGWEIYGNFVKFGLTVYFM